MAAAWKWLLICT